MKSAGHGARAAPVAITPWHREGLLAPKLYAVLSGFGGAAATVATKAFQREQRFDPVNFVARGRMRVCPAPESAPSVRRVGNPR